MGDRMTAAELVASQTKPKPKGNKFSAQRVEVDGISFDSKKEALRLTVDFGYTEVATGLTVYEDSKGAITRDYEVRRAVAAAQGITVIET